MHENVDEEKAAMAGVEEAPREEEAAAQHAVLNDPMMRRFTGGPSLEEQRDFQARHLAADLLRMVQNTRNTPVNEGDAALCLVAARAIYE
jgi:hypothetical protein